MKTTILLGVVLLAAGSAWGEDFAAPQTSHKYVPPPAKVAPRAPYDGAIPRAVHSGNPLQMVNPLAPAEYGTGAELVYYEHEYASQRPAFRGRHGTGVKLFSVAF